MVAESTEILRPITQFGWAQASSGVTCAERVRRARAERAARGGQDDLVDAPRPGGRILRQRLEDRRMLAVDGQQRRPALAHRAHEQLAADHQRLLVGQQQPLAGARGGQARAKPGRADDGGHHGIARPRARRSSRWRPRPRARAWAGRSASACRPAAGHAARSPSPRTAARTARTGPAARRPWLRPIARTPRSARDAGRSRRACWRRPSRSSRAP